MGSWLEEAAQDFEYLSLHDDATRLKILSGGAIGDNQIQNLRNRFASAKKIITSLEEFNQLLDDHTRVAKDYLTEAENSKLRCIFWNCGGLISKLEKITLFLKYVKQKRPDMIFLNELKCLEAEIDNDRTTVEKLADSLNYECIYTPSNSENGPSKRGSAILYREGNGKLKYVSNSKRSVQNDDMEEISGIFRFGNVYHKMICLYVAPKVSNAENKLINHLNQLGKCSRMITVGDFNIEKMFHLKNLQEETGFIDVLPLDLPTNYSSNGSSSIDYIMTKGINKKKMEYRCFEPNGYGHAMFAFTVPLPPQN